MVALKLKKTKIVYLICTIFFLMSFLTLIIIDKLVILLGVPELLLSGDIIWNYNSIKPPYDLDILPLNSMGAFEVLSYIFTYPLYFIKIFFIKLFWFLLRLRPFYSDLHNTFLLSSSLFLYGFSIISFFNKNNRIEAIYFMVLFIILITFTVLLTVVDWDARFSLPILPFLILFASSGVIKLTNILLTSKNSK